MKIPANKTLIESIVLMAATFLMADPIADGNPKFLGNVINFNVPADFSDYWNQVTPENFGKWGIVEPYRDSMQWDVLKNIYGFAKKNGYPFKQHTFIWGQMEPSWIGKLSRKEQKEELEEFFRLYAENFPETEFADVVNEPINAPPSYREALGGAGATGWDWVIWAFETARKYLPDTKLLINEYDIVNSSRNTDKYLLIINILKERGLIDGIGVQSHCFTLQGSKPEVIKSNLNKLAAAGLPIYSSELDLQGDDQLQKQRYRQYFPLFWEHPAVKGVTLWGYRYGRTWKETAWLKDSAGSDRPALIWLRNYVSTGDPGPEVIINNKPVITNMGNGYVKISSNEPVFLEIFHVNGQRFRSMTVDGNGQIYSLAKGWPGGMYILRVNRRSASRITILKPEKNTR